MPAQRYRHRDGQRAHLRQLKAGRKAQQQHDSPGTPASAKCAQLRPASTLGGADEHCSDSAVRRTFCTNGEPFAARPLVEKNTCAYRLYLQAP